MNNAPNGRTGEFLGDAHFWRNMHYIELYFDHGIPTQEFHDNLEELIVREIMEIEAAEEAEDDRCR